MSVKKEGGIMNLPTTGNITNSDIIKGVPEPLRHFIAIDSLPLPMSYKSIVEAFWMATKKINPVVCARKRIYVLLATAPFRVKLPNGDLQYTPNPDVINARIEDMVFLDCNKMITRPFSIQVACILEEFVHAFMNVTDEALASNIVAELYDGIKLSDGKYCLANEQNRISASNDIQPPIRTIPINP